MTDEQTVYVDRGEPLPATYALNRMAALVRDPECIFLYWDLTSELRVSGSSIVLRVMSLSDGGQHDIRPHPQADNMYLTVAPNSAYRVQLISLGADGAEAVLATSEDVATPVRWAPGADGEPPVEIQQAGKMAALRSESRRWSQPGAGRLPLGVSASGRRVAPRPAEAPAPQAKGPHYHTAQ